MFGRFLFWLVSHGNDELTDLWFVFVGIFTVFECLLGVYSAAETFEAWMTYFRITNKLFPIIVLMAAIRVIKNLFIMAIVIDSEDSAEDLLNALEES